MIRRRLIALVLTTLSLATFAACSDDSKVGSDKLKDFESQGGEGALGATTSTTAAPGAETTAPPATNVATTGPPTTKAPVATTAATAPPTTVTPIAITVKIQGDAQGNAFEPSNTRAYANSTIRFENVDSAPHQVKARNGEFASPTLAPGEKWDFKLAIAPGTYEYTDAARPYAVAYLEVLAR